jgi:hypothetical protein
MRRKTKNFLASALVATAILLLGSCSQDDDNGWKGGLVMTVHWEHYKDASVICHKLEAKAAGEDPKSFESDSIPHGCRSVKGRDCYVFTGEDSPSGTFGELVQDCFETREFEIDVERD